MNVHYKERVTYFAETDFRNKKTPFGIKTSDRSRHMYVIGKTGMGKSTLLENMAIQDIKNGEGVAFVDPHGKTADLLLDYIPPERVKDVVYFAPFDTDYPLSFNVMEDVGYDKRHLVVSGLMSAFKKIWVDAWSARMEYILGNTLLALLEYPDSTLLGINRMFTDKDYRKNVVDNIKDPTVRSFWVGEFAKYTDRYTQEATPAIQNKVGQFTSNPLIRNIIGQPKSSFDIRKMMDERKILIINLSKGRIGEGNANLLGSMLITKIYLAGMSRADIPENEQQKLPNFYLYVDEFQSFANESFADILSEARKYKLNLVIAHQYIEQMPEEVRAAVFGNVGTMVVFRVGAYDAEVLEKEFAPVFTAQDMVSLGFAQIYLKLMIDGVTSHPFSATTLPPIAPPAHSMREKVVEASRASYAKPRGQIEEEIRAWYEPVKAPLRSPEEYSGAGNGSRSEQRSFSKSLHAPRSFRDAQPSVSSEGRSAEPFGQDRRNEPIERRSNKDRRRRMFPEGIPETPEGSPEGGDADDAREFRKALSLDSLRKRGQKRDDKGPKAENLSQLKKALASALGKPPTGNGEEKRGEPVSPALPRQSAKDAREANNLSVDHGDKAHDTGGAQDRLRENSVPVAEVPEHVLRKILHGDDARNP